ncbi:DUF3068 domain-containing protein [Nocardia higoensis]|uniref:DUF3068 domain-containing protein n=1 Tax=Nocardia higoensis TaxID=228599 RepID=A0ABS0DDK9_9NOCA|nr:DUF3068 domain-containing protein [Nocardia higoensis]MBF6356556.1 DUF3068 domain-containing protein [Nocardia higoensis]
MALSAGTRRTVACLLVGLGALLIVMALLIPTYTVGKLAKTPLDLEITTIATSREDEPSRVLDSKSLTAPQGSAKIDENVPLLSQRFVTVEEPSDADQMTVQAGQTLRRTDRQGDTGLLTASVDRVTIDRKSGEPVATEPNGSISVSTNEKGEPITEPVQHVGLQYRFPIGTEKKDYPYFDLNARATYPAVFKEETEINGTTVYHFQNTVPATSMYDVVKAPTNRLTLPAAKWGLEGGDTPVTLTRYYKNVRDLYVEPQTGTVISGGESLHIFYGRSAEQEDVTALQSHLVFNEETIESQLAIAKDSIDTLNTFGRIVPIVLGVLGVIALIAGILLGIRGGSAPASASAGGFGPRGGSGFSSRTAPAAPAAPPAQGTVRRGADDAPTEQINVDKKNL